MYLIYYKLIVKQSSDEDWISNQGVRLELEGLYV
jgi:hypothetical protein